MPEEIFSRSGMQTCERQCVYMYESESLGVSVSERVRARLERLCARERESGIQNRQMRKIVC